MVPSVRAGLSTGGMGSGTVNGFGRGTLLVKTLPVLPCTPEEPQEAANGKRAIPIPARSTSLRLGFTNGPPRCDERHHM
ncbi:hypothetical protein GCM10022224_101560 [Nonomuraea antimicrobica]|uniref:Uncharacterized protein n=1 Tax=Nonomuraea antimicrobica TaxID=561173 RepID=A0ABP7EHJ5_9ACTN